MQVPHSILPHKCMVPTDYSTNTTCSKRSLILGDAMIGHWEIGIAHVWLHTVLVMVINLIWSIAHLNLPSPFEYVFLKWPLSYKMRPAIS